LILVAERCEYLLCGPNYYDNLYSGILKVRSTLKEKSIGSRASSIWISYRYNHQVFQLLRAVLNPYEILVVHTWKDIDEKRDFVAIEDHVENLEIELEIHM